MARIRRLLAFLLILTICLSLGEGLAFASESPDGESVPPAVTEPAEPAVPEESAVPAPTEATQVPAEPAVPETPQVPEVPEETPVPDVSAEPEVPEAPEATEAPEETAEPEATAEPALKQWPWTEPGNTVAAILAGGRTLSDGEDEYRSENGLWRNETLLADVDAANLNLVDGTLYYSVDENVFRMPSTGGAAETVFTAEKPVEQMYVMGREVRYLADGQVCSYDMGDGMTETLKTPAEKIAGFVPTEYGNIFLTGEKDNYTLYAGELPVLNGAAVRGVEAGQLLVTIGGADYSASLAGLFAGAAELLPYERPEESEEPEEAEEAERKQWPWTEPGATAASILSGGRYLTVGGVTYASEGGIWAGESYLSAANGENLNLSDGMLYYSVGNSVCRVPSTGGADETVYTADGIIDQMYVMGQEVRYISGGAAYSLDMNDGTVEELPAPEGVIGFIPTQYGNIYLTGDYFNYTLWAEENQIYTGVDSCRPEGEWLVLVAGGETYQTGLAALFEGSISLQAYSLGQTGGGSGLSDEQQLANEAAYLQSAEYAALTAGLTPVDGGSGDGTATVSTSHVRSKTLTTNQQNIVLRAQQMADVTWKCLVDRYSWGGNDGSYTSANANRNAKVTDTSNSSSIGKFLANHTYRGVPYSQAVSTGYVGWDISLSDFLTNTKQKNSVFYTKYSDWSRLAPYYGSDCSGFASYAWDLPVRCTCTSMLKYSQYIAYTGLGDLQVGDTLNNPNSHVVVITDIGYNASGNIVSVEVTEQTPPKMRVTCYGELITGRSYTYTGTIKDFLAYLSTGYSLYRRSCSSRPTVRRPADVADLNMAESPSISVAAAGPSQATVTLSHKDAGAKIYYTVDGAAPTTSSKLYTGPFTVTAAAGAAKVTVQAMAVVNGKNSFPLNEELQVSALPTLAIKGDTSGSGVYKTTADNGETVYYVKNNAALTLLANSDATVYYTIDGSNPSKSSSNGKSGAVNITGKSGRVIKAFAMSPDGIPSAIETFKIGVGSMYTISVVDPFGFISPAGSEHMVPEGESITFTLTTQIGSYKLKNVKLDGKDQGAQTRIALSNVKEDHKITVEVDTGYGDVSSGAWYGPAVAYTTQKGLFYGTKSVGNTQYFAPNDPVTRAMFVTVLGRFAKPSLYVSGARVSNWETVSNKIGVTQGSDINVRSGPATTYNPPVGTLTASGLYVYVYDEKTTDNVKWYYVQYDSNAAHKGYISSVYYGKALIDVCQFGDIVGSASVKYSYGYAQWAYLNDIVNGTSAVTFNPRGNISRQDVCVMIYNYLTKYMNKSLSTSGDLSKYSDGASVASYAADAMKAMINIGLIEGKPNSAGGTDLKPTTATSRAEVATIFMRLDKYLNG